MKAFLAPRRSALTPPMPWPPLPVAQPSLDLIDNEEMCSALDSRWPVFDGPSAAACRSLLLIDPAGRWADTILLKQAAACGQTAQRIRLLSPAGLRRQAIIDELNLAPLAGNGTAPAVLRHLRSSNLSPRHGSPGLDRLWHQTAMVALLVGTLPSDDAARWVLSACAVAARLGKEGPRWAIFMPSAAVRQPQSGEGPDWLAHMSFLAQPGAHSGEGSSVGVWNAILESWAALPA
jgi:hypothetical protein